MIRNDEELKDEELKVVREQLSRAESALESLRRDVLPNNERMYRVMSESYVDTILELRGHVDTFLGINELPANADLAITLQGDRAVNSTFVIMYWQIGKHNREDVLQNERAEYLPNVAGTSSSPETSKDDHEYGSISC